MLPTAVLPWTIEGGHEYGGYDFDWEVLEGGSVIDTALQNQDNLRAGTYSVDVYDNQGCYVRDTFELLQPTQIQIAVDPSLSVNGTTSLNCLDDENGTVTAEAYGGLGPYTYAVDEDQAHLLHQTAPLPVLMAECMW